MSRSNPYPAPSRLRHGSSQQNITLDDVLQAHEDVDKTKFAAAGFVKDSNSTPYAGKIKAQADDHYYSKSKYPPPSRLRRGTSQQDIDVSMLDFGESSSSDVHSNSQDAAAKPPEKATASDQS